MLRFFLLSVLMCGSLLSAGQARLKWNNTKVDLGTVKDWDSPEAVFTFTCSGKGSTVFLPQKYRQDMEVVAPSTTIRPGESGAIIIRYFTEKTGPFKHSIDVYHSASQKAVRLTITGNIRSIKENALTACPRFGPARTGSKTHKNVVIAVNSQTGEPIPDVDLKLLEDGDSKILTRTMPNGRSNHRIDVGKYMIYATKDGFYPTAAEVIFSSKNATHWIYMDPVGSKKKERRKEKKQDDPVLEEEVQIASSRWEDPEEIVEPVTENEPSMEEMGVGLNDQWSEEEVSRSSDDRWGDPDPITKIEEEPNLEDMGVSLNEQFTPEEVEKEEVKQKPQQPTDPVICEDPIALTDAELEAKIEALLAEAEARKEVSAGGPPAVSTENAIPEPVIEPEIVQEFSEKQYRKNNIVLLLDVSASMKKDGKMDKLKITINRLVGMLRDVDVLTIIAYNIRSWEMLPPTPVTDSDMILAMIDTLTPTGYTNGVKGMEQAFASLRAEFISGGNNQLILATDGKFNSSKFSEKDAMALVKANSNGGSVLSVIGFGENREATRMMKKMAKIGRGSFMQISGNEDATELLADEIKARSRKQ